MEVVLLLLMLGLGAYVLNLRSRVEELSERLRLLEFPKEKSVAPETLPVAAPPPLPPPLPKFEPRPEPIMREQIVQLPAPAAPEPTLSDRLRALVGDQEWESLIGGSVLNKLGAVVLVIGIALFLGFSFGRISPAGRAALAIVVSTGILGAGVWVERRDRYRFFARGLIGAGWAALYATAYAIYAIPAAQIVSNPFAGSVILLAVGAGMVAHSLKYRSQAVTAVAYFSAFAALAVTPSSPFAVISLIPLAASVLYLAVKFEWYSMALFGMVSDLRHLHFSRQFGRSAGRSAGTFPDLLAAVRALRSDSRQAPNREGRSRVDLLRQPDRLPGTFVSGVVASFAGAFVVCLRDWIGGLSGRRC